MTSRRCPKMCARRRRLGLGLCCLVSGAVLLGGCSTSSNSRAAAPRASAVCRTHATKTTAQSTPARPHIMIIMMENQSYNQVIGNASAPCVNTLAATYLRATNSHARGHDSLPNYLELISGHTYEASGTGQDCTPSSCGPIAGTTIVDQLRAAGIPWRAFMGAMPSNCDTSNAGGSGGYGVRHDPFVYFAQGRTGPECGHDVPATGLLTALHGPRPPDFVFYSPSICQDGGQDAPCSTIANGDRFLAKRIPQIMATPWYRDGGTIILTWDEGNDEGGQHGDDGGHVLTVVISARTKGQAPDGDYVDTAGILRTVEHAYRLSYLGDAAKSTSGTLPLGSNGG